MLKKNELALLNHLRVNSRKTLSIMSKETGIPVSTLFDTLKKLRKSISMRHVSLIDYSKLGYGVRVLYIMKSNNSDSLKEFLFNNENVNNLHYILNNMDFYAECVFRNIHELYNFKDKLSCFDVNFIQENFIIEDLKKEGMKIM